MQKLLVYPDDSELSNNNSRPNYKLFFCLGVETRERTPNCSHPLRAIAGLSHTGFSANLFLVYQWALCQTKEMGNCFPDLNPSLLPFHSTYTSEEEHGLERICPHGALVWVCEDLSLKALPFLFYPCVNLTPSFTQGTGRSEVLCCSESRDLPFLLKYLPLNGISSWRQWLNMKDKQVGMDKDCVPGAGRGGPLALWLLCFSHTYKRLDGSKAQPKYVPVPALTGQPGSLDMVPVLSLCC